MGDKVNCWRPSVKEYQVILVAILLVSLLLRLVMVFKGGAAFLAG